MNLDFFDVSNEKSPSPSPALPELLFEVNSLRQWYIELVEE